LQSLQIKESEAKERFAKLDELEGIANDYARLESENCRLTDLVADCNDAQARILYL